MMGVGLVCKIRASRTGVVVVKGIQRTFNLEICQSWRVFDKIYQMRYTDGEFDIWNFTKYLFRAFCKHRFTDCRRAAIESAACFPTLSVVTLSVKRNVVRACFGVANGVSLASVAGTCIMFTNLCYSQLNTLFYFYFSSSYLRIV